MANMRAIRTLKTLEKENRPASPEDQEVLSQYVGWGGIPQVFDERNAAWADEYRELKYTLTPEEYEGAESWLELCGIENGYTQDLSAASDELLPEFNFDGIF